MCPLGVVQKRVVNVYRLITRGTLEEKIMGLQKFKMSIANTVISQDNASLQSMGTEQLLDLFTLDKVRRAAPLGGGAQSLVTLTAPWRCPSASQGDRRERGERSPCASGKASMKSVLEGLGELWDQQQYDTEYNLDTFIHSLK